MLVPVDKKTNPGGGRGGNWAVSMDDVRCELLIFINQETKKKKGGQSKERDNSALFLYRLSEDVANPWVVDVRRVEPY